MPTLLTIVFSKFVTSQGFFESTEALSLHQIFQEFIEKQGIQIPSTISTYKNMSGLSTYSVNPDAKGKLLLFREDLNKEADLFLNSEICFNNILDFTKQILIVNLKNPFLPPSIYRDLSDIVSIHSETKEVISKADKEVICQQLVSNLKGHLISEVKPTREKDLKQLKLVLGFYLASIFLGLMIFFLSYHRKYKNL